VFGVLMETGYPEAVMSLPALSDGTASLYFSNGGGIIGAGGHPGPAVAARSLVAFAAHNLDHLVAAVEYPLLRPGHTRRKGVEGAAPESPEGESGSRA
jgi:hypothetical protein